MADAKKTTQQDNGLNYWPALVASAPVFAAKSIVGDLPKAGVEYAVERGVLGRGRFLKNLGHGLKGPGIGRAVGGGLGILTAPVFLHGTKKLESDDKKERLRGYALVGGSATSFAAGKAFLERFIGGRVHGSSALAAATGGAIRGAVRGTYKLPIALATAASIAASRKSGKDGEAPSNMRKILVPIVGGAAAGAIGRTIEEAAELGITRKSLKPFLKPRIQRQLMATGVGGAAGGALGGLVLAGAVEATTRLMNRNKEKTSSVESAALDAVIGAGKTLGGGYAAAVGQHMTTGAGWGYGAGAKALRRIGADGLLERHMRRSLHARSRQVAFGVKEGIQGKSYAGFRAGFVSNYAEPELMAAREIGIKIGRKLRDVPPAERAKAMRGMQAMLLDNGKALNIRTGTNPLLSPILGGMSVALKDLPEYGANRLLDAPRRTKLYRTMMRGGRGSDVAGLPEAGRLEAPPGWFKKNIPSAAAMATGIGLASFVPALSIVPMAAMPPGALESIPGALKAGLAVAQNVGAYMVNNPAHHLGGHGIISGLKNMAVSTPAMEAWLARKSNGGLRYGLFPAVDKSPGWRIVRDTLVSPATSMTERSVAPLVSVLKERGIAGAINKGGEAVDKYVRLPRARRRNKYLAGAAGVGIGLPAAGAYALSRRD